MTQELTLEAHALVRHVRDVGSSTMKRRDDTSVARSNDFTNREDCDMTKITDGQSWKLIAVDDTRTWPLYRVAPGPRSPSQSPTYTTSSTRSTHSPVHVPVIPGSCTSHAGAVRKFVSIIINRHHHSPTRPEKSNTLISEHRMESPRDPNNTTTVPSPARRERARVRAQGAKGRLPPKPPTPTITKHPKRAINHHVPPIVSRITHNPISALASSTVIIPPCTRFTTRSAFSDCDS